MSNNERKVQVVKVGSFRADIRPIMHKGDEKWRIFAYNKTGKRTNKGTFLDINKAKEKAFLVLKSFDHEVADRDSLTGDELDIIRMIREHGISKNDVYHLGMNLSKCQSITVEQAVKSFIASEVENEGFSLDHEKDYKRVTAEMAEKFKNRTLGSVLFAEVDDWMQTWVSPPEGSDLSPISPSRFNNKRSILHVFYNWAMPRNYVLKNHIDGVSTKRGKSNSGNHDVYSPKDFAVMLANCPSEILPWLCLSGFAGLRGVEIYGRKDDKECGLRWEDIDFDEKMIYLRGSSSKKTNSHKGVRIGKPRIIPMCDALVDWLKPWRNERGLVHSVAKKPNAGHNPWTLRIGKKIGGWKKNGLRSSRGSYRMAILKNITEITLEMGHSKEVFLNEYHNPRFEKDAELWFSLGREDVKRFIS